MESGWGVAETMAEDLRYSGGGYGVGILYTRNFQSIVNHGALINIKIKINS